MDEFIIKMSTFVEDVGSLSQNAKDASDQIGQQEEQPVNVENSVEMQGEASEQQPKDPTMGEQDQVPELEPQGDLESDDEDEDSDSKDKGNDNK